MLFNLGNQSIPRGSSGFAAKSLLEKWEQALQTFNKDAPATAKGAVLAGDRYVELWTEILAIRGMLRIST